MIKKCLALLMSAVFALSYSGMALAVDITATATTSGTAKFEVDVVNSTMLETNPYDPTATTLDFGTVNLNDYVGYFPAEPGGTGLNAKAIRINYLFATGTNAITISTNNVGNELAGMVESGGDYMPMCWRVTDIFPTSGEREAYGVIVNENEAEASLAGIINTALDITNAQVDLPDFPADPLRSDPDTTANEEEPYDVNHDGEIGYVQYLGDDEYVLFGESYLKHGYEENYMPGFYACYLHMTDDDLALAEYDDHPGANYRTVFSTTWGIQQAEDTFSSNNRIIYVDPEADFSSADIIDVSYTATLEIIAVSL